MCLLEKKRAHYKSTLTIYSHLYPQYLYYNGAKKFFTWFDYMVWYPLGRPVGSTIYPGMQFTAVFIKNHILPSLEL